MKLKTTLLSIIIFNTFCTIILAQQNLNADTLVFERAWGSRGTGDGQFIYPQGIAINSLGHVYIADTNNGRVQIFDQNGKFLRKITGLVPVGIAIDSQNRIYISSAGAGVQVYDQNGNFIRSWSGSGETQIRDAKGIAIDSQDRVYVSSAQDNQILVFDNVGNFIRKWGSFGSGIGQFSTSQGITIDSQNKIYIIDTFNNRIQLFSTDGSYLNKWGSLGFGLGELSKPNSMAIGSMGRFFVTDTGNNQIQIFNSEGNFLYKFGSTGDKLVQFNQPRGIAIDSVNRVYIVDQQNYRIQVFRPSYRTHGLAVPGALPTPQVISSTQRISTAVLDIDYKVIDPDNGTVSTYPAAFINGTTNLNSLILMTTFVDSTSANFGQNITTGVEHRISWDVGTDWNVDFGDLKIAIFANDGRGLIDLHLLHIPVVNGNPAFKINRSPLTNEDFLTAWFWLIASGDTAVRLQNGEVRGVGGDLENVLLAMDTSTSTEGRAFLFERLGVREATATEIQRAKEASTPGTVTQWQPRVVHPSRNQPTAVNEFNFDTGATSGWWIIKE